MKAKASEKHWWKEAVVYQIYPRSFKDSNNDGIGDIPGIIEKLDYLQDLGVDVIWLNPIYCSPNDDNGYDISNYYQIQPEFGTMEDLDHLLEQAHQKNLKIIMDLVVNHTSDEHPWFTHSRANTVNPYRNYYIWRPAHNGGPPNNWGSSFSGSAWQYDAQTDMYYLHTFSKKQPDLNWRNPEVRNEVYNIMRFWLDKGIDGFRMDVINYISKTEEMPDTPLNGRPYGSFAPHCIDGPNVHEYLKEMNRKVLSHYNIMTVGETPGVTLDHAIRYAGFDENELQMVFQFEHMRLDYGRYGKWHDNDVTLQALKKTLAKWQTGLQGIAWNSLYWNNHDQPRVVSRFGNDSTFRTRSAKMLGTCLHMMQGTPFIYQGEELGMTNIRMNDISEYRDIESINAFNQLTQRENVATDDMMQYLYCKSRDNARTPMQWSNDEYAGFSNTTPWIKVNPNYKEINADLQRNDPDSVFAFYKKLIHLRKQHEIIVYGDFQLLLQEDKHIFAYKRNYTEQELLVVCNFSDQIIEWPQEIGKPDASKIILSNLDATSMFADSLSPYEARVYLV